MSEPGEISSALRKRPPKGDMIAQWNWSRLIPVFVPNSKTSPKRSKRADLSGTSKGNGERGVSHLEVLAGWHLAAHKLDSYQPQYKFLPDRRFLFDFAWPDQKVALEIEGGIWLPKGAHSGGVAITRDMEKYNLAQLAGWLVLRAGKEHINDGRMVAWVKQALGIEDGKDKEGQG